MNQRQTKKMWLVLSLLFNIHRVKTHFFVILLKSREILPCFRELTLFHSLANIPVHESPLRVKQIEFTIQPSPRIRDGSRIGQHTNAPNHSSQIAIWDVSWWLVGDTNFETRRTPVNESDRAA